MVQLFKFLLKAEKKPLRAYLRNAFIDSLRLTVRGGHGGNGTPKYGGIGGQGGCVYFVAKDGISLRNVSQRYKTKRISASSGEDSSKVRILGRRGMDERVEVPLGVQVLGERGQLLGDLNEDNATCIAAGGGAGGCTGNNFLGAPGDHRNVSLDLKLIADVGLVGFPNAGKSTLLKAISNAKPKIASYPFTTIRPQIGTVDYPDLRRITIADLPGLIEGAHANIGMGHKFLKHVERTRLLLVMVDIFGFRLSAQHAKRNCLENIYALNKELELYDKTLLDKPCVLLLNKMDLKGASEFLKGVKPTIKNLESGLDNCPEEIRPSKLIKFERIIPISAQNVKRIDVVKEELRDVLDSLAEEKYLPDALEIREQLQRKVGERGPKIT
ncbi:GTP-binding protein 10 homolog [Rhagoletis pomonella]|uniref:GTP-binding protein 10 homolog n=1 Tax=Rhagoletis pomonella TaxID=28610 RepID=UPI0017801E92|nr:GTP-binding protein 10 homolog [Rhagoletis pomonella]